MKSLFSFAITLTCLALTQPRPATAQKYYRVFRSVYDLDSGKFRELKSTESAREDSADGHPHISNPKKQVIVTIVYVDLRSIMIEPYRVPSGRMTAERVARHLDSKVFPEKVLGVVNGGFFDAKHADGRSMSRIVSPRVRLTELPRDVSAKAWKVFQNRGELWIRSTSKGQTVSLKSAWDPNGYDPKFDTRRNGYFRSVPAGTWVLGGGGRILPSASGPAPDPGSGNRRARTVIGFNSATSNQVVFLLFDEQVGGGNGLSVSQVRKLSHHLGLDRVLFFDGGGSTSFTSRLPRGGFRNVVANEYNDKARKSIQRPVKTFLVIRSK